MMTYGISTLSGGSYSGGSSTSLPIVIDTGSGLVITSTTINSEGTLFL
jgi:hypothetical protein